MSATANCSEKLSREHYVSQNVLEQFQNEEFVVGGLPWIPQGETRTYSANALASRILCERHNSALSPLDVLGGLAMKQMTAAFVHAARDSLSTRTGFFLLSGDGLELWAIKTLMGLYHAKIAAVSGEGLAGEYAFNERTVIEALTAGILPEPLGLNVFPTTAVVDSRPGYQFSPLSSPTLKLLGGLRMATWGVHFDTLIDDRGANQEFFAQRKMYRPWVIDLSGPKRTARLVLTWARNRRRATRVQLDVRKRL